MRRTLHHPMLCILALLVLARPAAAQIDVAISPMAVAVQPVGYQVFGNGYGGVWSVFQGAAAGSALYAQHVLSDGTFAAGFGPSARVVAQSGTQVNGISATSDGQGGAIILWFGVNPRDPASPFVALRCQHLDMEGRVQYPDTGIVVSSIATAGMATGDGAGGVYVTWEELKSPSNPDIVAQHYGRLGDPLWTPSGSPTGRNVSAVVGIQRLRAIHPDGSGGAYVLWADSRTPSTAPLYAMRLTPAGVAGAPWTANGVRITPITGGIRVVGSSLSPSGGLWVAWRDNGIGNQFWAQSLTGNGSLLWPAAGATVASASPARADFAPASGGDLLVAWGGNDIRCSRLDSLGVRVWPEPGGRVIVIPPSSALDTRGATDGAGGMRLAWSYDTAGQNDLNIIRVDGAGAPWPGEPALGESFVATALQEDPVAWLTPGTSTPALAWLSGGFLFVRLAGGSLGVGPAGPRSAVALAPPSPNPMRGGALTLRFDAPAGPARLDLFDAAGRRVLARTVFSSGGSQSLRLDEAGRLPPGVYALRLTAAGGSATTRLARVD